MRAELCDVTVVLDRSGSMQVCRSDAEGGLNEFIRKQKQAPGDAVFTLVQFDTEYEFVHKAVPIQDVPHCTLHPRGCTALLDAVGRAIVETGNRLRAMPAADRPALVVIVVITDGLENSSREFTKEKVRQMIELQQQVYKWQFTYLGANHDAFDEAVRLGIDGAAAPYSNTFAAHDAAASNVNRMRRAAAAGAAVVNQYTDEEKERMTAPTK